jgi:hypothetical protein
MTNPPAPHEGPGAHQRLIGRLRDQAQEVRRLTADLSEAQLATRTVPDKWSLKELVAHLWRVQQVFGERIERLLREDNPSIAPYDPEADGEFAALVAQPTEALVRGLLADRARLVARLEGLAPAEWHRPGRHPEFPHYDLHFQVEYLVFHEAHHLYQMFQRRAPLAPVPH